MANTNDWGYNLAGAIIRQAGDDYISMKKKLFYLERGEGHPVWSDAEYRTWIESHIQEALSFFDTEWYSELSLNKLDGKYLIEQFDREYQEWETEELKKLEAEGA